MGGLFSARTHFDFRKSKPLDEWAEDMESVRHRVFTEALNTSDRGRGRGRSKSNVGVNGERGARERAHSVGSEASSVGTSVATSAATEEGGKKKKKNRGWVAKSKKKGRSKTK